jgi:hypothetical protein
MPDWVRDWSAPADIAVGGNICCDFAAPRRRRPSRYIYHAGMAVSIPETPSRGEQYYLSGRATVDALLEAESRKLPGAKTRKEGRYMPPLEVRENLRSRMKSAGVTFPDLARALGMTGNSSVRERFGGTIRWLPGDMEKIEAVIAEREEK